MVVDFFKELHCMKLKKITAYMRLLQTNGLALGEPYIKHLCDNMQNT